MSSTLSVYGWIRFNFEKIQIAVTSNDIFAVTDDSNNVLVWQEKSNICDLISIIISPVVIKDLKWVVNSHDLAIISDSRLLIWDVYENKQLSSYKIKDHVQYLVMLNKVVYIYTGSEIKILGEKESFQTEVNFSWIHNFQLFFHTKTGIFSLNREKVEVEKREVNIKKQLIRQNKIEFDGQTITYGDFRRTPTLRIPRGLQHYFNHIPLIIIYILDGIIIYHSRSFVIVTTRTRNPYGYVLLEHGRGLISQENSFLTINSDFGDIICNQNMLRRPLTSHIKVKPPFFSNAPSYLFAGTIDTQLSRIKVQDGYLWLSDGTHHHLYDIFTNTVADFFNTQYKKDTFVLLESDKRYFLEWNHGTSPPLGILQKRALDNSIHILYNREKHQHVPEKDFMDRNEETDQTKLIIPEWHSVNIAVVYKGDVVYNQYLSLSSIYYMVNLWSMDEYATKLQYENYTEKEDRLLFGDLELDGQVFYGIAPIWTVQDEIVVTVSIDKNCYVWEKGNEIPLHSFFLGLPILLKISKNKRYIAGIALYSDEYPFKTKQGETCSAYHPMIRIVVLDRQNGKVEKRELPFATRVIDDILDIEMDDIGVVFKIPSFIDLHVPITYSYTTKFQRFNPSNYKRYWMTHSTNTKLLQKKIGEEYPIDPHPEIRRELHFRPFQIFEGALVRKSDDLALLVAIQEETHPQVSEDDKYSFHDSLKLAVYYPNGRFVDIHFKYLGDVANNKHIVFEKLDEIPRYLQYRYAYKNPRFKELLRQIIRENAVHTKYGIAFQSTQNINTTLTRYAK